MARIYVPNPGFSKEIMREPETLDGLAKSAEGAAKHAENFAGRPWMPHPSGEHIVVVQDGGNVYIANRDYGGHLKEWGSRNNAPHAPLRRGVQAAGLGFKDEGR